jgi:hypothetical protein
MNDEVTVAHFTVLYSYEEIEADMWSVPGWFRLSQINPEFQFDAFKIRLTFCINDLTTFFDILNGRSLILVFLTLLSVYVFASAMQYSYFRFEPLGANSSYK